MLRSHAPNFRDLFDARVAHLIYGVCQGALLERPFDLGAEFDVKFDVKFGVEY